MGLTGAPQNSNPILAVRDGADTAYAPVPNSDTITRCKSPRRHWSTHYRRLLRLLRSSSVRRHTTQPRGESWKARAREREASVQARALGITALGVDRGVADKPQTYCPRLKG